MDFVNQVTSRFTASLTDSSTIQQWLAFLVLILIFSFLWSTVVKQVVD